MCMKLPGDARRGHEALAFVQTVCVTQGCFGTFFAASDKISIWSAYTWIPGPLLETTNSSGNALWASGASLKTRPNCVGVEVIFRHAGVLFTRILWEWRSTRYILLLRSTRRVTRGGWMGRTRNKFTSRSFLPHRVFQPDYCHFALYTMLEVL